MKTKSKLKINKIREFSFDDKLYSVVWKNKPFKGKHQAEVDHPENPVKQIRIAPTTFKKCDLQLLKALLDECFHIYAPTVENEFVDTFSEQVGEFLYKVGYHLDKEQINEKIK